ncbi:hypothetical protein PL81_36995 [Streptomyces sp. RSD-27]|nr:hypothetical protein PL81_36995 [Streptomyces sp. RSD-27]
MWSPARRLEVYDRIVERFGTERVAVTGMPETYRAWHALRDTGLGRGRLVRAAATRPDRPRSDINKAPSASSSGLQPLTSSSSPSSGPPTSST